MAEIVVPDDYHVYDEVTGTETKYKARGMEGRMKGRKGGRKEGRKEWRNKGRE